MPDQRRHLVSTLPVHPVKGTNRFGSLRGIGQSVNHHSRGGGRPLQIASSRRGSRALRLTPVSTTPHPKSPTITLDINIETETATIQQEKQDSSTWRKLVHRVESKLHLRKHISKDEQDEGFSNSGSSTVVDSHKLNERAIPGFRKTGTWLRDELDNAKLRRKKIFGRAPWNRKDSTATFTSVSSSLRDVLRGDTPPASPLMPCSTAYDNHRWMSNTFPGGEAVRVSTPPMDEDTADGRPRGFFSSLTPPEPEITSSQSCMPPTMVSYGSPKYNAHRMSIAVPSREWWEQKPQKPPRHADARPMARFEFDIPEHLPTSPMCPANVRHKSGGTGLCVYHGRRRALSTVRDGSQMRRNSASTS
ncbi:hypothetical protein NQ176_g10052 [Zarea fungicola]|uniref:Uncharacterized protein n=1 Tax=Zarea fungicola TaxID=93591 RepID=A0ACC1MK42_9HYPO|nr:hypothetical protein NQ176_g10052 [Lecanicillium fungicola]